MASLCRKAVTFRCGFFATNRSPFFAPLHPGSAVGSASPSERHACVDSCLRYCHCCTPPLPGRLSGMGKGISDGEEHRALLEECRHGARGGAVAGARDGWLKRERGLSSALPLPAYTRWMGQRCHRLAPGGAADPMEAFRRDSPSQEMTGVARRLAPICCLVPPATPTMTQCAARRFANALATIQRSNWLARRPH